MTQTHLPPQWQQRVLANINSHGWDIGQFAHQAIRLLTAWQQAEGGLAEWNPLNTTLHIPGWYATPDYNTTGVCNYTKPTYGVMATVATLINGSYNGILGFLQNPQVTAEDCVNAHTDEFRTWGTNPDVILQCLKTVA